MFRATWASFTAARLAVSSPSPPKPVPLGRSSAIPPGSSLLKI